MTHQCLFDCKTAKKHNDRWFIDGESRPYCREACAESSARMRGMVICGSCGTFGNGSLRRILMVAKPSGPGLKEPQIKRDSRQLELLPWPFI